MNSRDVFLASLSIVLLTLAFLFPPIKTTASPFLTEPFISDFSVAKKETLSRYILFDVSSVALGIRRFAADIAWIQLLQYVGTSGEDYLSKEEKFLLEYGSSKVLFGINFLDEKKAAELKERLKKNAQTRSKIHYAPYEMTTEERRQLHPDLLSLTLRVARLDPYFKYAYLFSGGALAWNYDRTDEALAILCEGIKNNPDYWQFHLYISAILYKKNLKHDEMITLLEQAVRQKDAPNMVRVILANYYEKMGRLRDSLKIWLDVVETKDSMYYEKGLEKVEKFSKALGIR